MASGVMASSSLRSSLMTTSVRALARARSSGSFRTVYGPTLSRPATLVMRSSPCPERMQRVTQTRRRAGSADG